jgi:MFS family permease
MAAGLVAWLGIRPTLYLAAIPGVLAAVAITLAAREARRTPSATPAGPAAARPARRLELGALRQAGMIRALLPVALFELGNVATTLLILRATQLLTTEARSVTEATSLAILCYAGHNVVAAVAALLGGRWLDRTGPRAVFAAAAVLYVLAYTGFALPVSSLALLVPVFCLAGAGIGLAETTESTLVARMLPDRLRGSGFGVLGAVQAGGDLLASAVAGLLYALASPTVAFGYVAAWMLLAVLGTGLLRPARS